MITDVKYDINFLLSLTISYMDKDTGEESKKVVNVQSGTVYTVKYKKLLDSPIDRNPIGPISINEITGRVAKIDGATGRITVDASKIMESNVVEINPSEILDIVIVGG